MPAHLFNTAIAGSLPKPGWLSETNKLWPAWKAEGADLAQAKADAWEKAVHDDDLPNAVQEAIIIGFASPTQGELLAPYVDRYFEDIRGVWERRSSEVAQNVVRGLFPTWTSTITPETVRAADEFLAQNDPPAALRRLVVEGRADIQRALAARAADAEAATA